MMDLMVSTQTFGIYLVVYSTYIFFFYTYMMGQFNFTCFICEERKNMPLFLKILK